MFETRLPQRLLLKFSHGRKDLEREPPFIFPSDDLKTAILAKGMTLPASGSITHLSRIGDIFVYVYTFDDAIACSSATNEDFYYTYQSDGHLISLQPQYQVNPCDRNVGWAFFCLGKKASPLNQDGTFNYTFTYPEVKSEVARVDALKVSIMNYYKSSVNVSFLNNLTKFCQFTGGGDFLIEGGAETAVFLGDNANRDIEDVSVGVFEGKKGDVQSVVALCNQLKANMILACVTTFTDKLQQNVFSCDELMKMKILSS